MSLVIPEGFAAVSLTLTLTGQARPSFITFGVGWDSAFSDVANANNIVDRYVAAMASVTDTQVTIGPASCRVGQAAGDPIVVISDPSHNGPGTSNRSSPPSNVAVLVKKNTSFGGRAGRGRMFLPWGVDEANITEQGTIAAASLASIQTALNNFLAALDGDPNNTMFLLHNNTSTITTREPGIKTVTVVPVDAPPPFGVNSLTAVALVSTQRRRLGR